MNSSRSAYRLGFDARLAGQQHAGIGRYAEELLRGLTATNTLQLADGSSVTPHWIIFVSPNHGMKWLEERVHASPFLELRESSVRHYSLAEQTVWPMQLMAEDLDLLHVPHFNVPWLYQRPTLVTIHDLLWHTQRDARATTLPPWLYRLKYWGYRLITNAAIQRARAILVPSQTVKDEVKQFTGRSKNVFVTPEGIAATYAQGALATTKKSVTPYIVYTGSLYPHKNVEVVWQALKLLPQLKMKVVSARSVFLNEARKRVKSLGIENQVEFLSNVSDSDLVKLYQGAVALVQPSRAEGFGLTPLEAMAVGCPVVVSDRPIFHEVLGEHANYAHPDSVEEWTHAIEDMLAHPPSEAERRAAQAFARTYTWERCVEATQAVYGTLLTQV